MVEAIDQKNWEEYARLLTSDGQEDFALFAANPTNKSEKVGLYNLRSARVREMQSISAETLGRVTRIAAYKLTYQEILGVYAGLDCTVYTDTGDFVNGENYQLFVLGGRNHC